MHDLIVADFDSLQKLNRLYYVCKMRAAKLSARRNRQEERVKQRDSDLKSSVNDIFYDFSVAH